MTLQSGSRLGPYEIVARIGAGGMGEVFRARDTRLDRTVAVKILPAAHAANAQLRLRFEREAKVISALNHPHICSLYDVGRESEIDFLVMEFIDGETIADRIVRGALPIDDVIRYGIQIAGALERAHRQGIVHRDLKPGNIMLTRNGVKLLDFGLARMTAAPVAHDDTTMEKEAKPLTSEGTIVGTFQYMAPEQLEGLEADTRTDIFALGALLYEMATGRRAFDGKTRTSVIAAIVAGSPRPMAELQPLAPAAFEYLVQRCLEKDRDERWQSTHDVKLELLRIEQQRNESAAGVRPPRVPWIAAAVAGVIAVAAIGFAIRTARQPKPSPLHGFFLPPAGAAIKPVQLAVLSIAPSGRMITFGTGLGDTRLWVRSTGADDAHPLPGTDGGQFPFWSPDETWIAFFAEEKLMKVSLAGTPPVTICGAPKGRDGTWSEDGTILFSPDAQSPIHRVAARGGTSAPVTKLDASQHETSHRWVKLLSDGKHFIYLAVSHADSKRQDQNAVWFASIDKPGDRKLVIHTRYNVAAGGGRLFYAKQGVLVAQTFDAERGELRGEPERIAGDLETDDLYFKSAFDVSRDGTVVYHIHSNDLRVIRRDGDVATPIGAKAHIRQIVLSPDGNRAAAEVFDDSSGTSDIWIYDLENGEATRFTATPDEHDSGIAWMPDGRNLIHTTGKGLAAGESHVYISSIDGSQRRELTNVAMDAIPWCVTPDGSTLVYGIQTRHSDNGDLWMAPIAGGPAKPFLESSENECCATLSPDGKWIAYYTSSDANTIGALSVARFPSGSGKTSIPCDSQFGGLWTTNGIVCFNPAGAFLVPVTASDAAIHFGKPADLHFPALTFFAAGSRDGKRFVYATHEETREEQAIAIVRP